MRYQQRRIKTGSQEYDTKLEINGYEDDYLVIYSESAPEPDVGLAQGGIEIEGVYFEDQGCVMGQMSEDELDALAMEIGDSLQSGWEGAAQDYHERD